MRYVCFRDRCSGDITNNFYRPIRRSQSLFRCVFAFAPDCRIEALTSFIAVSGVLGALVGGQMYDHLKNGWEACCW